MRRPLGIAMSAYGVKQRGTDTPRVLRRSARANAGPRSAIGVEAQQPKIAKAENPPTGEYIGKTQQEPA